MKNLYIIVASAVALLAFIPTAPAGEPLEIVENKLGKVIDLLQKTGEAARPELSAKERKAEIRAIIDDSFDFEKLSQRALSRSRSKFSDLQYDRFVNLFAEILFTTYYTRMRDYDVESISYKPEHMFDENTAEVRTVVQTADQTYSIDYRLSRKGDTWLVYDVSIEGVSLVKNYRSQFTSILKSKSSEKLLEMLSKKVSANNAKDKASK